MASSSSSITSDGAPLAAAWCKGSFSSCVYETRVCAQKVHGVAGREFSGRTSAKQGSWQTAPPPRRILLAHELGCTRYPSKRRLRSWPRAAASSTQKWRPWRQRRAGAAFRPEKRAVTRCVWLVDRITQDHRARVWPDACYVVNCAATPQCLCVCGGSDGLFVRRQPGPARNARLVY